MRPIPPALRKRIASDPSYAQCARWNDGGCRGRITIEHALIYAGRQVNELWALIPLCWRHHLGAGLDKRENQRIALEKATDDDLKKYPSFRQLKKYLTGRHRKSTASEEWQR